MTTDNPTAEKLGVALFGMSYLYKAGDVGFHMQMVNLGLRRSSPLIFGYPNRAIVANKYEYWITDYENEEEVWEKCNLVPTYTVEDFVQEIKKMKTSQNNGTINPL